MRSEKELLKILLENIEDLKKGLCLLLLKLCRKELISNDEYFLIKKYIELNAPNRYCDDGDERAYNWEAGLSEPRIDWLNEQIAKL